MLTPEIIAALRDAAGKVASPINEFLIQDIARRISKAGQFTSSAAYQIYRAQQLGMSRKEIKKALQKQLSVSSKEIEQLLTQTAEVGYNFDMKNLSTAAVPFDTNANVQQMVNAAVKLAKKDFSNLTQTLGMVAPDGQTYPLQDAYQKSMDYAFEQVFTGATDYNTAIRQATKNIADKGVRVVDYASGVHTGIEAAARRNIMGGLGLMVEKVTQQNHDQFGANGWEISAHAASASDHEPIQGKQYSDSDYMKLNSSLVRRIGTLNCGHMAFPIILGVNEQQYTPEQLQKFKDDNAVGIDYQGRHYSMYEATQAQRRVETAMRTQKNRCLVADATGDKEQLTVCQIRLIRLKDEYFRFSKAAGLPMQNERVQVAGFGKNQAQKVVMANKKAISDFKMQHISSISFADSLNIHSQNAIINNKPLYFSNRAEADKLFRPWTEETWKNLSTLEKKAAYEYTVSSGKFNRPLRGYNGSWDNFVGIGNVDLDNEGAGRMISDLKNAIQKSEIKEDVWLFRGSDQQSLAGLLGIDKSKVILSNTSALNKKFSGVITNDAGFFSTGVAADAGFKDSINYEILVPKGSKGLYAEPFSCFGHTNSTGTWDGIQKGSSIGSEAEVILNAGTHFKIVEIKQTSEKINIILEVVTEEG